MILSIKSRRTTGNKTDLISALLSKEMPTYTERSSPLIIIEEFEIFIERRTKEVT